MPDYFTELKNGPSGPSYKVKDEEAQSSIESLVDDVSDVKDALAEKADTEDIPDLVSDNLAKGILGNETVLSTDTVPFVSKTMGAGKYQRKKFVGCSFVWNQLVDSDTESVTIASGHKYALYQNGAWSIGASSGTAISVTGGSDLLINLTQLFGSTAIADYIYNLEQATAGAGIAKLKELGFFTENYYAYDAGSVQSVDIKEYAVTGFNLWDEQWEVSNVPFSGANLQSKNIIKVFPNAAYFIQNSTVSIGSRGVNIAYYDSNDNVISTDRIYTTSVTIPNNCYGIKFGFATNYYGTTYNNDICINLSDPARNGQYEPYHKTTYSLTPTELRGVPKIDANNNIYCDGDEYASDGGHKSNYSIADMGTLEWEYTGTDVPRFQTTLSAIKLTGDNSVPANAICSKYAVKSWIDVANDGETGIACNGSSPIVAVVDSAYTSAADFKAAMSGVYLVYKKATPTTETLTPFDYPQSVGSLEEITDYKVEQEDRDVAIPTGHVTEYMGKGGEFTLPTLPETPSVLAYDGHNFFWKPETS